MRTQSRVRSSLFRSKNPRNRVDAKVLRLLVLLLLLKSMLLLNTPRGLTIQNPSGVLLCFSSFNVKKALLYVHSFETVEFFNAARLSLLSSYSCAR